MKTKLILLLLLLFTVSSFATTTTITSLPYTFDASMMSATDTDTLVLGASKLSSATSGITLNATWGNPLTDVVLNLGTDTLEFGTAGGNSNVGIRLSGTSTYHPHNIKIIGGHIIHNPSNNSADLNRCLRISGWGNVIENVNAVVRGYNGKVLSGSGASIHSDTIRGGIFRSEVTAFNSRCNYDASVVELVDLRQASLIDNGADIHWYIDGLTITNGPHTGIIILGREGGGFYGKAKILNCSITTDGRNDFYTSGSSTCNSAANPYSIVLRNVGECLVYNNTIMSGTSWAGNRGILIERSESADSNTPIIVRKNIIDIHEGPSAESSPPVHGIRIRYAVGAILIDSNTITVNSDSDLGTSHTGLSAQAIRLSFGTVLETDVIIRHNRIRAKALDVNTDDCIAIVFDEMTADFVMVSKFNNITSSGIIYKYGDFNSEGLAQLVEGDTVGFEPIKLSSAATYHVGHLGNNWDCSGNISRDITYTNGTSDTDIKFASNGTLDITIQKTLEVNVMGNNNYVVSGATVSIVNGYGETVMSGLTNSYGRFSGSVSYWFESRTQTDSTNYNNFSLTVQKGSDTYVSDFVVDKDVILPAVNLLNTAGEIDSIPPDPILDLGCTPGTSDGSINLQWTSTGDDGSSGTGLLYEIKYSTNTINASNFESISTVASNPPIPQVAGSAQSMTLSGLTPGINYNIAMKIFDDGGNSSLISNVVNCEAFVDITTGGGDTTDQFVSNLLIPESGAVVQTAQPILLAQNITAIGTNNYYFEVSTNQFFTNLVTASPAVLESNSNFTDWQVDIELVSDQTYYWRVKVNDNPYSAVSDFSYATSLLSEIIAYPNPVSFTNGQQVAFTSPPNVTAELTIQTISGENVFHKIGFLDPASWTWNGINSTNYTVAIGTYLWYIQIDGQTYSGKIVNK